MKHTPREEQILDLLLQGCANAEIAKELGIKVRSVKAALNRLFLRHGINDPRYLNRVVLTAKVYQERQKQ